MSTLNCWGFRIDWRKAELQEELKAGRLRQGWGWDAKQNLKNLQLDEGAKANLPILDKVRKGDYLLIPHVPSYHYVTIVQAAEDFSKGYQFDIYPKFGDYGHVFPIEKNSIVFARNNACVEASIKTSLRTPMRFWNMNGSKDAILKLFNIDSKLLLSSSQNEQRAVEVLEEAIATTLHEDELRSNLYKLFEQSFRASEWEFALRKALEIVLPNCFVKRVGGKSESQHGCDLAVYFPAIESDRRYVIGIQIKDHEGQESSNVINQVNKADEYDWTEDGECKFIEKYIIIVDSSKKENTKLEKLSKDEKNPIRVLYRDDVLDLLARAAKIQMANNLLNI